ncbi:MAG: RnfABCDGE type electron transport complex subunit G [Candidatus Omnitrophica bacterium]|nr:RnfABCDGE type electron transport complex subunit G [Candidatus Omnitrophota bacterium]
MTEVLQTEDKKAKMIMDKESLPILLLVLTLTCVIGAGGLSLTYNTTKDTINATVLREQNETIKKVLPEFKGEITTRMIPVADQEIPFFIAREKNEIVGIATIASENGYGGPVKVMVGILPDSSIYGVELLQHQETPGLGAKAAGEDFRSQFKGKVCRSPNETLIVRKAGEKAHGPERSVNAITAATITSAAFTDAVNKALVSFQAHKEKLLSAK